MDCPYAGDSVVHEVKMVAHGALCGEPLVGRFVVMGMKRPFWTMETVQQEWIDINPAHVMSVTPASGKAYNAFVAQYGED